MPAEEGKWKVRERSHCVYKSNLLGIEAIYVDAAVFADDQDFLLDLASLLIIDDVFGATLRL